MTEAYLRTVTVDGRLYSVCPPRWGDWQAAIDAGLGAGPAPDLAALLEHCLLPSVQGPEGRLTPRQLRDLPAAAGDALLAAALEMLEQEREGLALRRTDLADGVRLEAAGLTLKLRPWTFGQRNRALAACLRLTDGQPRLDQPAFERTMVCTCTTRLTDEKALPLMPADVANWPVPLGEAVVQLLDELNGVDPGRDAVLQACVRQGIAHPDLTLLHLCQTFGWTPEAVESLAAHQAERLLGALRALGAPPPGQQTAPASHPDGGEVTRILVAE